MLTSDEEVWLRQEGATLAVWRGERLPVRFGDPQGEYRAVRQRTGLIPWCTHTVVEARGVDRAAFLHNLLTNDLKHLAPGRALRAGLTSASAKLIAELLVLAEPSSHTLIVDRRRCQRVLDALAHYLIMEDVALADLSGQQRLLALQGPATDQLLKQVGLPIPMQAFEHCAATLDGASVRLLRHSLTGSPGVVLFVSTAHRDALWRRIMQAGAPLGLSPIGWEAFDMLRLEAGIAWDAVDLDESNLLPETGLERTAVSDTKGCYVGQEVIARMHTYGSASRKLVGLLIEGRVVPEPRDMILAGDEEAGEVSSSALSPERHQPIALAWVKRPHYQEGTRLAIVHDGHRLAATVTARQA